MVTVKGTTGYRPDGPRSMVKQMATKNVENAQVTAPAPAEWTPDEVRALNALAKAAKYWTASETQVALFDSLNGPAIVANAPVKSYKMALDVDRLYLDSTGPDSADASIRALAVALTDGGCRAHATAYLLGIPPRFVSGMVSGGRKAAAAAATATAA